MHSQDDLGEYTRKFSKVSALLIANKKIAKTEQDMFYISGFLTSIQDRICHRLVIVKLDLHLDDPYPMDNVVSAAKFLLTGSALRSSIPNSSSRQQCPQQQPRYSQPVASVPSFNPAPAMKAESNFAVCPPVCGFCAKSGHWIRTCSTCLEYINSGKVVRGSTGRLCLPDGSDIPCVPGGRCLKDSIDHALATQQSATASSSSFSRDQPPHVSANLLSVSYDTPAILEIDTSVFTTTASDMDCRWSLNVTHPEFQLYITQAWANL